VYNHVCTCLTFLFFLQVKNKPYRLREEYAFVLENSAVANKDIHITYTKLSQVRLGCVLRDLACVIHDLAVLEELEGGVAPHPELCGQLLVFCCIHLFEDQLVSFPCKTTPSS
jgi:hypothetical protein